MFDFPIECSEEESETKIFEKTWKSNEKSVTEALTSWKTTPVVINLELSLAYSNFHSSKENIYFQEHSQVKKRSCYLPYCYKGSG